MSKFEIYVGDASETGRPYTIDDPNNTQPLDNWLLVGAGETAEQAVGEFIEELNSEQISVTNSWVRLVTN